MSAGNVSDQSEERAMDAAWGPLMSAEKERELRIWQAEKRRELGLIR